MDLYTKMGKEMKSLFQDLFIPQKKEAIVKKMQKILHTAKQIGGLMEKQAEELNQDILAYLEKPHDHHLFKKVKEHSLKLEEQTWEL